MYSLKLFVYTIFTLSLSIPFLEGIIPFSQRNLKDSESGALPVVIWHGMGDSCCNPFTVGAVKQLIEDKLGVFVYSIATGSTPAGDVFSTFFGNVNDQVAEACAEIRSIPELQKGYNALGFSQGGQFMRALVERCQHMGPAARSLLTFGAQHQGVMNVPGCRDDAAAGVCAAMQLALSAGAYMPLVRTHVVQAQYFKDPYNLAGYLQHNAFLADVNNEREPKNALYKDNLASLQKLVLFKFTDEDMVVPADSAWFSFFDGTATVPLRDQPLYREDWLGLKALDEAGRLEMNELPGHHMQIKLDWFADYLIPNYLS